MTPILRNTIISTIKWQSHNTVHKKNNHQMTNKILCHVPGPGSQEYIGPSHASVLNQSIFGVVYILAILLQLHNRQWHVSLMLLHSSVHLVHSNRSTGVNARCVRCNRTHACQCKQMCSCNTV